ncbi:hypothetical protein L1887_02499 [Cichorium endivia]|nr:hypothetical protein L1887_02499 [Cichorium endivia]
MKNMKANMLGFNVWTPEEPTPKRRNKDTANVKEKGKSDILPPSGKSGSPDDQRKKLQSSKQSVNMNKGKEKITEPPAKPTNMWETMPVGYHSKGIIIGSPQRSPLPVHENAVISTKSKDKTPTEVRTESKTPKRRTRQKSVAVPSCGKMIYPQDLVDAGMHLSPAIKKHSAWFSLTPFCDQNRKDTLQLLVEPYIEIITDGKCQPDVSILMKYIVLQLKHVCQEEVGIFMNGKLLAPEMKLLDVLKQWMTIVGSERKITKIGSSAENFCVKLTYGRRK